MVEWDAAPWGCTVAGCSSICSEDHIPLSNWPPEDVPCARVHPRPLSVWKVAGWSPPGEHSTNSGWTRREIRARLSSTNTERPPEDVPCLPQTAANMKALGTHTVCKPEPEIPEWTCILVHVLCSFCMIIIHTCLYRVSASYQVAEQFGVNV